MGKSITVFLFACLAASAQGTISGPSLGLMYDPAVKAIRPILGVPGSASVGKPFDLGFTVAAAAISPTQSFALAISDGGSLNLVTFTADAASAQPLNSAATPDRMVLSASGSSAVLYYKTGGVQILTGLPAAPQIGSRIDVTALPGAPGALAVSDDGAVLVAGLSEPPPNIAGRRPRSHRQTSNGLFIIPADGSAPQSVSAQHVSALAFMPNSHDALVADSRANSITLIRDIAGQSTAAWTFTDPGLIAPDAVAASVDGKTILAASSTTGILARFDSSGANPVFVPCKCTPTELLAMTAPAVYQVTEPANGLLWIFDSNPANPRVLFVPVSSGASAGMGTETQ